MQEKQQQQQLNLSKNNKILYNLLQIRIFDLSQSLQVAGHKFSINQIKESLEKQHNIFGQLQRIYEELRMTNLYEMMKQISQNYISISSILLDHKNSCFQIGNMQSQQLLYSKSENQKGKQKFEKISISQSSQNLIKKDQAQQLPICQQSFSQITKLNSQPTSFIHKLGGIALYHQNYFRGIQIIQKQREIRNQKKKKRIDQRQLIRQLIQKEISEEVEVEKIKQNDEIVKFIKDGKRKHQSYSHIQYDKDLEGISLFLKQSQEDALKFLTDSKKCKQQEGEQDMIITYHELLQILAKKKKNQIQMIESKIKDIVNTLKIQINLLEDEIINKDYRIRQLQYKLRKKQGKQYGTQTAGFKLKFNLQNSSSMNIQQIQEQHKIVVETLKKNLQANQKQLLNTEAQLRIIEQKIKKKDTQITNQNEEIQKLKRLLKGQKQKLNLTNKSGQNQWQNMKNSRSEQLQESSQLTTMMDDQQNIQPVLEQKVILTRSNKKRKHRKSIINGSSTGVNSLSSLLKGKQSSQNFEDDNKSLIRKDTKVDNTLKPISQEGAYNSHSQKSSQISNIKIQSSKVSFSNLITQKQFTNNSINIKKSTSIQGHNFYEQYKEESLNRSKLLQIKNTLPSNKQEHQLLNESNNGLKTNQITILPENYAQILQKNARLLYSIVFASINIQENSKEPKFNKKQYQLSQIKSFIRKYNQFQLQKKLKKIKKALITQNSQKIIITQSNKNGKFHPNKNQENYSSNTKEQQVQTILSPKKIVHITSLTKSNKNIFIDQTKNQQQQLQNVNNCIALNQQFNSQKKKLKKATVMSSSPHNKQTKQQILQKIRRKKPSKTYLKKLHQQIRISGKGFNISKKQFLDICQRINATYTQQSNNSTNKDSKECENHLSYQQPHDNIDNDNFEKEKQLYCYFQSQQQQQQYQQAQNPLYQQENGPAITPFNTTPKKKYDAIYNSMLNSKGSKSKSINVNNKHFPIPSPHLRTSQATPFQLCSPKKTLYPQKNNNLASCQLLSFNKNVNTSISSTVQQNHRNVLNKKSSNRNEQFSGDLQKKQKIKEIFGKLIKKKYGQTKNQSQMQSKLEEILFLNRHDNNELFNLELEDLLKIHRIMDNSNTQDILNKIYEQIKCSHNHNITKSLKNKEFKEIGPCCGHLKKYIAFYQRLLMHQQTMKKTKKDLFNLHICNIDGRQSQQDYYIKRKVSNQKDINTNSKEFSQTKRKIIQQSSHQTYENSYRNSFKASDKRLSQKQNLKKHPISQHIDPKYIKDKTRECYFPQLNKKKINRS